VIVQAFVKPDQVFATGIKMNGEKYTVFKAEGQILMGRKVVAVMSLELSRLTLAAGEGGYRDRPDSTGSHRGASPGQYPNATMREYYGSVG
jgi:hypothetical protein